MDSACALQIGSQIRCPHCRQWHPVITGHTEGTEYTVRMLYFVCRTGRYYAGQTGQTRGWEMRRNHRDERRGLVIQRELWGLEPGIGKH